MLLSDVIWSNSTPAATTVPPISSLRRRRSMSKISFSACMRLRRFLLHQVQLVGRWTWTHRTHYSTFWKVLSLGTRAAVGGTQLSEEKAPALISPADFLLGDLINVIVMMFKKPSRTLASLQSWSLRSSLCCLISHNFNVCVCSNASRTSMRPGDVVGSQVGHYVSR